MNMVPGLKNVDLNFKISFLFQFLVLVVSEKMLLDPILVSGIWLLNTKIVSEKWLLDAKLVSGKWLLGSI